MSDSFVRAPTITVVAIGDTETVLFDPGPNNTTDAQAGYVNVQLMMSDGSVQVRRYQLANHFSATVINQLISFVATIRSKANAEILPSEE